MKIRFLAGGLLTATFLAAPVAANATEPSLPTEVGPLHVFAVQPDGCTPGYIQINHADGVGSWVVDGHSLANLRSPSARLPFEGGFQSDVYATPAEGYTLNQSVQGSQAHPFYLTVNPVSPSCFEPEPEPEPNPTTGPIRPCYQQGWEPGQSCFHDARHQGDGKGRSYVLRKGDGMVTFISHSAAHSMLKAWRKYINPNRQPVGVPPCKFEDGSGQVKCVWDGRHMGNRRGHSLLARDGEFKRITHHRAHRLLTLWRNR